MLQHQPALFPNPPAISRDAANHDVVINRGGRTEIRLAEIERGEPPHWYWEITVLHRGTVRAVTTSLGKLPHAVFHAIQACTALGLLQPPWHVRRKWYAQKFWHIRTGPYVENRLSCRCTQPCNVHRPLLTVNTAAEGRLTAMCMGKTFVTDNALALAQFVAEQLIARRYLR